MISEIRQVIFYSEIVTDMSLLFSTKVNFTDHLFPLPQFYFIKVLIIINYVYINKNVCIFTDFLNKIIINFLQLNSKLLVNYQSRCLQ